MVHWPHTLSTMRTLPFSMALLLLSATTAFAADDEKDNTDFLLNVFSDIGPILALFGEQFARQFLSETFTWEDHIIFACIPLGIITAISGAIRVQGGGLFKAVIGRARENHAAAEIEYMSSTSTEVCELYNGEGIVRTMGKPYIGQIIVCPDQFPNGTGCGIHTLETAKEDQIMYYQAYQLETRPRLLKWFGLSSASTDVKTNHTKPETDRRRDLENGMTGEQDALSSDRHGTRRATSTEHYVPLRQLSNHSSRRQLRQETLLNGRSSPSRQDTSRTTAQNGHKTEKKNPWLTLKSPNLQLNIPCKDVSEKKHSTHLILAAIVALIMQAGLLAIAVSTVYFISGFEPEPWGLPCYLGGSILLFFGMLACSVAIEKRTRELTWYIPASEPLQDRKQFHLIWVQRNQRVSEQDFGSYIIDGGTRHHITTSSRYEDLEGLEKVDQSVHESTTAETVTADASSTGYEGSGENQEFSFSLLLPLAAVLFGGTGFTVQFIGLRGLPWPCAISQLGAMIIMAIIRALIRRRLTKTLKHHYVLEKHELDYLAIQLVEKKGKVFDDDPNKKDPTGSWDIGTKVRSALSKMGRNKPYQNQRPSTEVLVWKVDTASDVTFKPKEDSGAQHAHTKFELLFKPRHNTVGTDSDPGITDANGSETTFTRDGQLAVLVRKRLGDLCKWPNSTSKSALALTLSIERFMKEFFPEGLRTKGSDTVTWKIPFIHSHSSDQTSLTWIELHVELDNDAKTWKVDNGQVEAILSLWVAHWTAHRADDLELETQKGSKKRQSTDWRRSGDGSHVEYCRRIGENRNGVLKRDISWWVNNAVEGLQQEDREKGSGADGDTSAGLKENRFEFGFNCVKMSDGDKQPSNPEISISSGGPGHSRTPVNCEVSGGLEMSNSSKTPEFLVQHSTADLVTVMAQHLFTCFIWNIGGLLPKNILNRADININEFVKVESSPLFDLPSSVKAQSGRRLSHRQLTKFVNYAEKQGLGTPDDILLCIIPTFSSFDCLPNNIVLAYDQLLPKPLGGFDAEGQREQCNHHINLLACIVAKKGMEEDEYLAFATVVNTMEFVYLTALHVTKAKACGTSENTYPEEFVELLVKLLEHFGVLLRKLSPFYGLQRRLKTFKGLFRDLTNSTNIDDIWPFDWKEQKKDTDFMHKIGFTIWHRKVVEIEQGLWLDLQILLVLVENGTERDIFGWTPLHYAAARPDLKFQPKKAESPTEAGDKQLETTLNGNLQTYRWVDKFRRSPVHIAAAAGNINLLKILLPYLHHEARVAVFKGGVDEMDPLHLAAQGDHKNCKRDAETDNPQEEHTEGNYNECITILLQHMHDVRNHTDAWNQSPIQTTLTRQCYECTHSLLENQSLNFNPERLDQFKKSLMSYFNVKDKRHRLIGKELLLKHYRKFQTQKSGSDSILHHAVRLLEPNDLRTLLEVLNTPTVPVQPPLNVDITNKEGQTPLYLAVLADNRGLVRCLVDAGASPSVQDENRISPMILACKQGYAFIADDLLINGKYRGSESDMEGKTALHHVASSSSWSEWLRLDAVRQLSKVMKSIDVLDNQDETPLQSAVIANQERVCLDLLRNKASIKLVDVKRLSALNKIVQSGPEMERKSLAKWESQIRETTVKKANEQDGHGDTALHMAVYQGDNDTLDWLMQNKVDLHMENNSGRTAFIEACRIENCHSFIRRVVHALNSIAAKPKSSQTPHLEGGTDSEQDLPSTDWSQNLVRTKFNINAGDSMFDQSPLAWACEDGLENVVQILLEAKDIDVKRKATEYDNYTPLHFALASKNSAIVQLLLDHSEGHVIWDVPDENGFTTIKFAIKNTNGDCLNKLLMHPKGRRGELSCSDPGAVLKVCVGYNIQPSDWDWISGRIALDETAEQNFVDADKWTLADIAGKYGHPNLQRHLRNKMEKSIPVPHLRPSLFFGDYSGLSFTNNPTSSPGRTITMNVTFSGSFSEHWYFRTHEAIPPEDSNFYFEVKIIRLPKNYVFTLGFCGEEIPKYRAPGWDPGSWAYHSDDGGLFEGDGRAVVEDAKHSCGQGDTMGCGVNFETGQGYRTLNGVLLDSGNAFTSGWLKIGKLYPCVGFRDSGNGGKLEAEIALLGPGTRSFKSDLPQNERARNHLMIKK
ncbi:hypothetical protein NXS19_002238 [Fusarium pseudograminearum]|nr:hypothetical protein NXS19_002238 [Fusarium pseudograminearum]